MSKTAVYTIGIFLILATAGGLFYWVSTSKASQTDIEDRAINIPAVDSDILQDKSVKLILDKKISENVPVQAEEYNNEFIF